ncbi:MAG: hypothetical protein DRQ56_05805 [Gammaproteobacteria bacterium]|nr:MAG: hypothetical protein DRQ56_05805 [Gammaproteobacteria bacterium]
MIVKILATTDGKYVGLSFDTEVPMIAPDGVTFHPTKIQNMGNGYFQFSNSNYVVLTKQVG